MIPTLWFLRQRWWWQLVLRRPFSFSPLKFWALANTSLPPAQEPVNQSHHHGDTSLSLSHLSLSFFPSPISMRTHWKWRVSDSCQCFGGLMFIRCGFFFFCITYVAHVSQHAVPFLPAWEWSRRPAGATSNYVYNIDEKQTDSERGLAVALLSGNVIEAHELSDTAVKWY